MYLFCTLAVASLLGLIPANIAKEKGYSFGLWWFYGWMLFIVAIIHVQFLPDKNINNTEYRPNSIPYCPPSNANAPDELRKYKELLDQGVITEEEFEKKKRQLLGL
jgi:uncharacterized membrane protein